MLVFVTGSTGLLGGNLCRALIERGHQVRGLARSSSKAARLLPAEVEVVEGDLADPGAFASGLSDCQAVVHCAAFFREYFQPGDHAAQLQRYNVEASLQLLKAAQERGIPHFVQVSSSGTIGPNGNEDAPPSHLSQSNLYFRSKLECDRRLAVQSQQTRLTTVLPGWMWGPGDAAPTAAGQLVMDFLQGKLPAVPPGGTSLVDARDVASGIVQLLENPPVQNRYILGGRKTSLRQIVDGLAVCTGKPAPRWNIPFWVAYLVAWGSENWARWSGKPTAMTREGVRTLKDFHTVDSSRAQRDLGVRFRPLEETLRDTVDWLNGKTEPLGKRPKTPDFS